MHTASFRSSLILKVFRTGIGIEAGGHVVGRHVTYGPRGYGRTTAFIPGDMRGVVQKCTAAINECIIRAGEFFWVMGVLLCHGVFGVYKVDG